MSIFLNLLKEDLEEDEAGFPAGFDKIPEHLLTLLAKEAGKKRRDQIKYTEEILKALNKIGQTNSHKGAPCLDEGTNQEASKTQGTLPGAHQASPTEEAAIEPATPAGRDKEGAQILEHGAHWITEDDPSWELQPMEGKSHQLQQTAPPALPDDRALPSEQPLAERTLHYSGPLNNWGSH
jgi:hypothetical protein